MLDNFVENSKVQLKAAGTFRDNKNEPLHCWFNYTEGFSYKLVREILTSYPESRMIVDPFAGSATTGVESALAGKLFHGYDINPVMTLIGEGKSVHSFRLAKKIQSGDLKLTSIYRTISNVIENSPREIVLKNVFEDKKYYGKANLNQIFKIRSNIETIEDVDLKRVLLLALLAVCVDVSNLKRSPDLKYKPEDQWNLKKASSEFANKANQMIKDLAIIELSKIGKAKIFDGTAKKLNSTGNGEADLIITSPPYLNGTNYCRNTKLELWISGILASDDDLKKIRTDSISCSINSAQKRNYELTEWKAINKTIKKIEESAYDPRIPPMVANYFHDMAASIESMYRVLKRKGVVYSVMGDSAFNGVHIPTQEHLDQIAKAIGFRKTHMIHLRDRRSRGGMPLSEVIQIFEK